MTTQIRRLACAAALLALSAAACDKPAPGKVTEVAGAQSVYIARNTQATIEDVEIAAGNMREEEFTDEHGREREELTAALWLSVRDDASQNRTVRVHRGQKLSVGAITLEVRSVEDDAVHVAATARPRVP
jgi:hypothetical protein